MIEMTTCLWCDRPELHENYRPEEGMDFICSACTQSFVNMTQDRIKELWEKCTARGLERKLDALKSFVREEEYVPETTKTGRNMVRKRPLRSARPARNQIRAQQATF